MDDLAVLRKENPYSRTRFPCFARHPSSECVKEPFLLSAIPFDLELDSEAAESVRQIGNSRKNKVPCGIEILVRPLSSYIQ